jgi:twitching motility protein PilT
VKLSGGFGMITEDKVKYPVTLDELLRLTVGKKGSDLHLVAGAVPSIRINGEIERQDYPVLTPQDIEHLLKDILAAAQWEKLKNEWELDFSYSIAGVARFRGNAMVQRGSFAAVFRVVPYVVPVLDELGLPRDIKKLCELSRGLVLVTGPTGNGKSTTLAALIDILNSERKLNIVTVEDPIEFLHRHKMSTVRQREIGTDTHSFANALRHVLRHDPDVILIGEMRDVESISIALTAAETGHLVFSTLHTQTAPLTISRIVDVFQSDRREQVRQQLSNSLRAVIAQQLVPTADGKGRVAAVEYMIDTPAIRSLIREGKEHQLYNAIQTGQSFGMQTMDMALARLYFEGKITRETALERCIEKTELERMIKGNFNGFIQL